MFAFLLRYNFAHAAAYFRTRRAAKFITAGLFLLVMWGVALAVYNFFRWEFALVVHDPYLRIALPLYIYELLFLAIFWLVFLSAFINGLFGFFKRGNDGWVIASPQYPTIFWGNYFRVLLASLWPLLLIALPAFLGIRVSYPMTTAGVFVSILSMIFLVGFAVSLATLFIMCLAKLFSLFPERNGRSFLSLGRVVACALIVLIALNLFAWYRLGSEDILRIFQPRDLSWAVSSIDVILAQFAIFPSHFAALTLFNVAIGNATGAWLATVSILLFFASALLLFWASSRWYLRIWQILQEGRFEARPRTRVPRVMNFSPHFSSPIGSFFVKEVIVTLRDMRNLLWFGFLFFLWFIQSVMGFFIRHNMTRYHTNPAQISAIIQTFEFAIAAYFASALVLRFALPAFSTERKTTWIFGTAPLKLGHVFWGKLAFYGATFSVLGMLLAALNSFITAIPPSDALLSLALVGISVFFITALGLSLGTIFPNFDTDDPGVLSTSLPGLGFILASLSYGSAGSYCVYEFLLGEGSGGLVAFLAFTAVALYALLRFTLQRLQKFEFVKIF